MKRYVFDTWTEVGDAINEGVELNKAKNTIKRYLDYCFHNKAESNPKAIVFVTGQIKKVNAVKRFLKKYPDLLEFFI